MRFSFLIIPSVMMFQAAVAQTGPSSLTSVQGTTTPAVAVSSPGTVTPAEQPITTSSSASGETLIMDYKSVYEAATLEEEVQLATDRFKLTQSQQDVWLTAATDRRRAEKTVSTQLESKDQNYSRDAMYKGLRTAQNEFYETIIGYLTPAQKMALEADRAIMEEKRKRIAKLPPPPPPVPTVTVAPVDSAAIKAAEKAKLPAKKSKKKKKPAGS